MAGYPPPYSPLGYDAKAQRRMYKDQVRFQREQMKLQRRAMRRSSLVGPVLLVTLGVIFLLVEMGRLHWWPVLEWFGRWWPLLLIAAGVVLLVEWTLDQRTQRQRAADGLPPIGSRSVGGGVIWLLVIVAILGGLAHTSAGARNWDDRNFHFGIGDFDRALGNAHDSDDSLTHAISADGVLTIDNPRGDVTVSGTSDDGQMHVAVHKRVFSFQDDEAQSKARDLQPTVTESGGWYSLRVPSIKGGMADLTVDVPRGVTLNVTADRGDVRVGTLHAPVTVNANRGNVDVSGVTGAVVAHLHSDGANFSAHSITGAVTSDGRTGDVNVSDVHGDLSLSGAYAGTTHLERVDGAVRFHTHRTDFQMARLDGEVELDTGSDLRADQMMGPVILKTDDRNITLERLQGNVQVVNTNGSVTLTSAAPLGTIDVTNRRGSVDVGVPAAASFTVEAATRHGDVENDFALPKTGSDDHPEMSGIVGHGGPMVRIQTTDGDVTVRKSLVAPLPPVAPVPPKITIAPVAPPAVPAVRGPAMKLPKAPKVPATKAPDAPVPPTP